MVGAGRSCDRRDVHYALERCILHSRCAVKSARSSAKCTSRRPGTGPAPRGASRERGDSRGRRPCRGPRRRGLSKSVAKARILPGCAKRNVDIPRFFSRPIAPRSAFATDLDMSPPRSAPGAPRAPLLPRPRPSVPSCRSASSVRRSDVRARARARGRGTPTGGAPRPGGAPEHVHGAGRLRPPARWSVGGRRPILPLSGAD